MSERIGLPSTVLTLNIRHGSGKRVANVIEFLANHPADIVVLTEFRNNANGEQIIQFLEGRGQTCAFPNGVSPRQNTVLIAGRGLKPTSLGTECPVPWSVVTGELYGVTVIGLYFPGKQHKRPVFSWLSNPAMPLNRVMLVGDMNTGLNDRDLQGDAKFHCGTEFRNLSTEQYVDAFRHMNGDSREYSWYSTKGNGFRIDHILVSQDLAHRVDTAQYHQETVGCVSDHAAMSILIAIDGRH